MGELRLESRPDLRCSHGRAPLSLEGVQRLSQSWCQHRDTMPRTRWPLSRLSKGGEGRMHLEAAGCWVPAESRHAGLCHKEQSGSLHPNSTCPIPQRRPSEPPSPAAHAALAAISRRMRVPPREGAGRWVPTHREERHEHDPAGRGQGEQGPSSPAPVHACRRGAHEPHGKPSRSGCGQTTLWLGQSSVSGTIWWHLCPQRSKQGEGRELLGRLTPRHVLRTASPDHRTWLAERVEAMLLRVSLYKAPNNICLSLHRSLGET